MFLLAFATMVTIPPQKRNKSTLFLKKIMFPPPNSCGKIVSSLTCSILPHDRCPRRRPWLCPSLPIHIFVDNDFKLTRMFQIKLSNLVFCTNQNNVDDKASPTGLVVLALRIRLTHNQATGESVKDRSFLKTLLCALFRRNQL